MHGYKSLIKANAEELPSKECAFSLIIALDILEHLDDSKVLKESYRVLKPNGYLIVRVPAFASLWSKRDGALQHKRRYSKVQLVAVNAFFILLLKIESFLILHVNLPIGISLICVGKVSK
jgi:ubiquinone/menaquinone biosynthesis C-methylase UbiE